MDSSTSIVPLTPRRSTRLQQRQKTPEPYVRGGPQAMAKLNREKKKKMNQTLPAITITSPPKEPAKDPVQVTKQAEVEKKVEAMPAVEEQKKEDPVASNVDQKQVEPAQKAEEQKKEHPVTSNVDQKKVEPSPAVKEQKRDPVTSNVDQKQIDAMSAVEEQKKEHPVTSNVDQKQVEPAQKAEEQKQEVPVASNVDQKKVEPSPAVKEQKGDPVTSNVDQKQIEPTPVEEKKKEDPVACKVQEQEDLPAITCKPEPVIPLPVSLSEEPRHETYAEVVAHKVEEEQPEENKNEQLTVKAEEVLNTTPNLMDVSVISVPESVEPNEPSLTRKDATFSPEPNKTGDGTFSPVADKSLHDSRPHIDADQPYTNLNITPLPRNVTQRTSTPLAQKFIKRDTPKAGSSAISSLAQVLSPRINISIVQALNDTVNGQFKLVNPLERSILKSTRKRSLSMTEGESFVQKKVIFISPKVMDIGEIDERMMQSYIDEKENSRIAQGKPHRKRSLSASEAPVKVEKGKTPAKKVPDFKAIHEARFARMETLNEYQERKAQRAKKLLTPSKSVPVDAVLQPKIEPKGAAKSKIPLGTQRWPLVAKAQENPKVQRPLKRSMSAEPQPVVPVKKPMLSKMPLSRAMSQDIKEKARLNFPMLKAKSQASLHANKVEERRERNMALYKTNATRTGSADVRKKNENILKGVRLNRRFELLMKNREAHASAENDA